MEIDTTPLVDVMLVLPVIFIMTEPLSHQTVPADLPEVDASKLDDKPTSVQVAVDAKAGLFVDGARVAPTVLGVRLAELVRRGGSAVQMHTRADRGTRYEQVAEVMASTRLAGLAKPAFVTEGALRSRRTNGTSGSRKRRGEQMNRASHRRIDVPSGPAAVRSSDLTKMLRAAQHAIAPSASRRKPLRRNRLLAAVTPTPLSTGGHRS